MDPSDIDSICILGSGPIKIGQAVEFDYSGSQAIKALKEKGFEVTLVNSNPATIQTDPSLADHTYIEPLEKTSIRNILKEQRPSALLPTMGGQTGLNLSIELEEEGTLDELDVELIGVDPEVIDRAENRQRFSRIAEDLGIDQPRSMTAESLSEARDRAEELGFPLVIRPSFTMGGAGGDIVYNRDELREKARWALKKSPADQILMDESLIGWKEYELELMRDHKGNIAVICGIENVDPLGIHTGDSITVAPFQTLSDHQYQQMRTDAFRIMEEVGVETGGCNVQFAVDPQTGRQVIIEMNPRVSRSSALASKATGYPIAKIASLLAVGYSLDELENDLTGTSAAFEPMIDYTVVKMPRWNFDKFPGAEERLATQMKAVGEVMALGRTFPEALMKAVQSLEHDRSDGLLPINDEEDFSERYFSSRLAQPNPDRLWHIAEALRWGMDRSEIHEMTGWDPWFLRQIEKITDVQQHIQDTRIANHRDLYERAKELGMGDEEIRYWSEGFLLPYEEEPSYNCVDTCAGEYPTQTTYYYSTHSDRSGSEHRPDREGRKIAILGSGPNRIGQGVEFDYCAVHASMALADLGIESIMINCNPETVSTDYDVSDRLYFEPLTYEHVSRVLDHEQADGVVLQFGGQTPLDLAEELSKEYRIYGSNHEAIEITEDRESFSRLIDRLDLNQPDHRILSEVDPLFSDSFDIDFPLLVRPSFVLGGEGMFLAENRAQLEQKIDRLPPIDEDHPMIVDQFLDSAVEVDVDCIADGSHVTVCGIMEHLEPAGTHSGDSSCIVPPQSLGESVQRRLTDQAQRIGRHLEVEGLMNIQFAVRDGSIFVIEVNPRASRTIPFISKATGHPFARYAMKIMSGEDDLDSLGLRSKDRLQTNLSAVKRVEFPFDNFPEVDPFFGPSMSSTGEVMGVDPRPEKAYQKATISAGKMIPEEGTVLISLRDEDKHDDFREVVVGLQQAGFDLWATEGTAAFLDGTVDVRRINKLYEGDPDIIDALINGQIDLVINSTGSSLNSRREGTSIRSVCEDHDIPYCMNLKTARLLLKVLQDREFSPHAL